jgi:K+-transporting ATPase ATPase C chain
MLQQLRISIVMLSILTILTGIVYPLIVTVIGQSLFTIQANGSLIKTGDHYSGSEWIGQNFSDPQYFWGRLSATSTVPYNAAASSGSNYGPLNPELLKAVQLRMEAIQSFKHPEGPIPVDLVTTSGSGLDPHISPAAAEYQIPRVAAARNMSETAVKELVQKYTESRQFGNLGEPRVNVLQLNLALDHSTSP